MRASEWPIILIATTNRGKTSEIRAALVGLPVTWLTLSDLPEATEPDEIGTSFAENAWIEARAYADWSKLPTVAEDSGLVVDALGGRPGVLSARYPGATYAEKFANLYRELAEHAEPWTARFVSALAFALPGRPAPRFTCEGTVEGRLVSAPRGANGFGYDPIFAYPPSGRTGGELDDREKLAVSHRGQAFRAFHRWLEEA